MVDASALKADEGRMLNYETVGEILCNRYQPAISEWENPLCHWQGILIARSG